MSSTLAGHADFHHVDQLDHHGSDRHARLVGLVGGIAFSIAAWATIVAGVESLLRLV